MREIFDSKKEPKKPERKRYKSFTMKLTFEQYDALKKMAGDMPLGPFVKWQIFDPDKPKPKTRNKVPVQDHKLIAQVIAVLGKTKLASNLNQMAKAVNSGSLPITPETEADIQTACKAIQLMRDACLKALGLPE